VGRGVPLERDRQIDGVALLVQVLADEAFVPDQQAGDPSEPVPDRSSTFAGVSAKTTIPSRRTTWPWKPK
jgi:hypothetical protein